MRPTNVNGWPVHVAVTLLLLTPSGLVAQSGAGVEVQHAIAHDVSPPLGSMTFPAPKDANPKDLDPDEDADLAAHPLAMSPKQAAGLPPGAATNNPPVVIPPAAAAVEQTAPGAKHGPEMLASFEGLGASFTGPQGRARLGNPSDNTLAVGPDHIVQIVNTRMAVFTKKGAKFDTTGKVLLGPVETRNVFQGFGDAGRINNGDAVIRYDQLANRWLIVMPIFQRMPNWTNVPPGPKSGEPAQFSQAAVTNQPGPDKLLFQPPPVAAGATNDQTGTNGFGRGRRAFAAQGTNDPSGTNGPGRGRRGGGGRGAQVGAYAMCYAISTGPDPLGSYYRYEFLRPLFPDYPRPAVWTDGYYVPTSTGDTVIQKQAFVVEREKMLKGEDAREQGVIVDGVNFLNCADIDGRLLPPAGAPEIVLAAGGSQLRHVIEDDGIYAWSYHVDWNDPSKTKLEGPTKIAVAPYHYLGGGQLSSAVPQPGVTRRLDSQGDKLMSRVVYRRIGGQESIVAVHSIATVAGGGVRWYEFRLDDQRAAKLYQQGTYAPEGDYRWMASPAIDALGNIGIGYSFGGTNNFPGQRFAGRMAGDPLGALTLHETVLVEGEASQASGLRWEDYTQTAVDPSDDRTIWYVGDYLRKGDTAYSTRIGAFRLAAN